MKTYLSKLIGNHFLNELLAIEINRNVFKEIGSIINKTTLEFIIYTIPANHDIILKIAKQTFEERYWDIYLVLHVKYFLEWKIRFVNKKFSQKEIRNFTYHYFIPEETENRYIYKYSSVNKNLKKLLNNNSLWFSSPQNFPDITDCKFEVDTEPSKKNILNFYYEKYRQVIDEANKMLDISDFEKTFKYPSKNQFNADLLEHHYNGVFSKLGVTCFSEKYDNKIMWDRYAEGSKGVCLIFDTVVIGDHYKFKGQKVRYFKTLPKYFFDASGKMEIGHIVFSKTTEYKIENEIREVINFQFEDKIDRNIEFNPIALVGIIIGPNCSKKNKDIIQCLINKRKYRHVELIESRVDNRLNIKLFKHSIHLNEKKAIVNVRYSYR